MADINETKKEKQEVQVVEQIDEAPAKFRWRITDTHSPPEIYNWRLYCGIAVFGLLGSLRGLDEGASASTSLPSFQRRFGLDDELMDEHTHAELLGNIKAMVQLGSVLGAMISTFLVDKMGRLRSLQLSCFMMIVTTLIQYFATSVGQLYAGRFLEGALSVGLTVAIGPAYTAEVTPKAIRGMAGCIFAGAVYYGIMGSYFANYGATINIPDDTDRQWRTPLCVKFIIPGLLLVASIWALESPRWLVKVGKNELAIKNLCKLRNLPETHPFIVAEITDITDSVQQEKDAKRDNNFFGLFWQLIRVKSLRYRFFAIGCTCQLLGQWSGANTVTMYASELYEYAGIQGNQKLLMTAMLGVVKFTFAYIGAFFIIDFLGRRKAMYLGISLQMAALLYFALFLVIVPHASDPTSVLTPSERNASRAAVASIIVSGIGWVIGFNSLQYLIGSEIFPIGIRAFAQSLIMVLHFANQYGNSKAVTKMVIGMQPYGTFFFFVAINICSMIWAWFFIPELSGRSLESMEELFNLPWYLIGRRGNELAKDHSETSRIDYSQGALRYLDDKDSTEHLENSRERRDRRSEDLKDPED